MAVQWLRLCAPTAGGMDSIPGQGTKISQAVWHGQRKKRERKRDKRREGEWRAHLSHVLQLLLLLHPQLAGSLKEVLGPLLGHLLQIVELLAVPPNHFLLFHDLLACGHCVLWEPRRD